MLGTIVWGMFQQEGQFTNQPMAEKRAFLPGEDNLAHYYIASLKIYLHILCINDPHCVHKYLGNGA